MPSGMGCLDRPPRREPRCGATVPQSNCVLLHKLRCKNRTLGKITPLCSRMAIPFHLGMSLLLSVCERTPLQLPLTCPTGDSHTAVGRHRIPTVGAGYPYRDHFTEEKTEVQEARPLAPGQTDDRPCLEPQPQILGTELSFPAREQRQTHPAFVLGFP